MKVYLHNSHQRFQQHQSNRHHHFPHYLYYFTHHYPKQFPSSNSIPGIIGKRALLPSALFAAALEPAAFPSALPLEHVHWTRVEHI
jgi:hypothetical protein